MLYFPIVLFYTTLPACSNMPWILRSWCEIDPDSYTSGRLFNYQAVYKIKQDMPIAQVVKILGNPYKIIDNVTGKQFIWTYSRANKVKTFAAQFNKKHQLTTKEYTEY